MKGRLTNELLFDWLLMGELLLLLLVVELLWLLCDDLRALSCSIGVAVVGDDVGDVAAEEGREEVEDDEEEADDEDGDMIMVDSSLDAST